MVAIRDSEIIDPLEIYYDKKHNLVILRALANISGAEWDIAELIIELSKKLKAKEIISIEGVASEKLGKKSSVYYYTNLKNGKFQQAKIEDFKNGVIVGVTGVLLLKNKELPLSCIFADADPSLPDSRAAGEIIKALDSYLGLKVDYKPLFKAAEKFEGKLKELMSSVKKVSDKKQEKDTSYLG